MSTMHKRQKYASHVVLQYYFTSSRYNIEFASVCNRIISAEHYSHEYYQDQEHLWLGESYIT